MACTTSLSVGPRDRTIVQPSSAQNDSLLILHSRIKAAKSKIPVSTANHNPGMPPAPDSALDWLYLTLFNVLVSIDRSILMRLIRNRSLSHIKRDKAGGHTGPPASEKRRLLAQSAPAAASLACPFPCGVETAPPVSVVWASGLPAMNASTNSWASSSWCWTAGDFMK